MTSALAYAPRQSPLGRAAAGAAAIHLWSFAVLAFAVTNPIVLGGCALAVVIAGGGERARGAGACGALGGNAWDPDRGGERARPQRGDTILVRGPEVPVLGTLDITAEALAEGAVLALRITIVFAAFAVHTACVDPDRLMRLARPLARRSALTATLIARLAPLAAADHARVSEAAALRGRERRPSAASRSFAAWSRARSTAPSTSPPRWSSAGTPARRRVGPRAGRGRRVTSRLRSRASARSGWW